MHFDVLHPDELTASDVDRWRRLQGTTPDLDNAFLSSEFVRAVARLTGSVRVARLREGGETVGYFPFEHQGVGLGRPVGAGLSDCHGVIHAPGVSWDADALLKACGLAVVEFDHLVAGQTGFERYVSRTEPSPIVDLSGGADRYIEARGRESRSFRRLLARQAALYAEHRDVRFEYRTVDDAALSTLFAWKSAQYRRTGRFDRFARRWVRQLVRDLMASETEHFSGVLASLWADGKIIAVQAALATPTAMSLWFPAHSPEFAHYSPGNLLRLELVRAAAGRGISRIDMGKGFSAHKELLKTSELHVADARVARRTARALVYRLYREPPRRVERFVLDRPGLRRAARHTLARIGSVRTRVHPDAHVQRAAGRSSL